MEGPPELDLVGMDPQETELVDPGFSLKSCNTVSPATCLHTHTHARARTEVHPKQNVWTQSAFASDLLQDTQPGEGQTVWGLSLLAQTKCKVLSVLSRPVTHLTEEC